MTNKEKAYNILSQLFIKQESKRNAIYWEYSNEEIQEIQKGINELQDVLVAMIPD